MRLVIAEKPSVSQSIAAVLGAKSRHDGYLEGGGYIVSWCFGHLAELADAAVYNADDAKWTLAALPIIPTSFRFIVRSEKQKQFDILRELMRREDVAEVVNACDAGRDVYKRQSLSCRPPARATTVRPATSIRWT